MNKKQRCVGCSVCHSCWNKYHIGGKQVRVFVLVVGSVLFTLSKFTHSLIYLLAVVKKLECKLNGAQHQSYFLPNSIQGPPSPLSTNKRSLNEIDDEAVVYFCVILSLTQQVAQDPKRLKFSPDTIPAESPVPLIDDEIDFTGTINNKAQANLIGGEGWTIYDDVTPVALPFVTPFHPASTRGRHDVHPNSLRELFVVLMGRDNISCKGVFNSNLP